MTGNYSLYSIPIYWFLALAPHGYAISLAKRCNNGHWDNTNPRNDGTLARALARQELARYQRAEAAHMNGLENAPLFIGGVVVGNMVGLGASTMNAYAGAYLSLRVVYNLLYINTETLGKSRARSVVWIVGTLSLFALWIKAAGKLLADS
ncbi:hypothetical protein SVAN01_04626 [Stagonosporopsis vannaccii]|nr:hypothetical protein SVAN01_04626 [Stagonosporopsis vannaccii]